jgi:small basic protein
MLKTTLRNILAVIVGVVIGASVNMGIIMVSGKIIPPPAGADLTTMEGLQSSLHLFKPIHFLMPFLAHALGTFVGAFVASLLGVSKQLRLSLIVGVVFLAGGIQMILNYHRLCGSISQTLS